MLDNDVINPKDVEIARLNFTIQKFKEYDEGRKKYINSLKREIENLQIQLEDVQAEMAEMANEDERCKEIANLQDKLNELKKNYTHISNLYLLSKKPEVLDQVSEEQSKLLLQVDLVKKQNKDLRAREFRMRKQMGELIYQIHTDKPISVEKLKKILGVPEDADILADE